MSESKQKWVGRNRPPRVQITYDVETGGAIVMRELPFIVGILANLSGKPKEPLPVLKERKFILIDRDNYDEVMEGIKPRLSFRVPLVLNGSNPGDSKEDPKSAAPPPKKKTSDDKVDESKKKSEEPESKPPKKTATPAGDGDGKKMPVELFFSKLEDFAPVNIVLQVSDLKELYDKRLHLRDMLGKMDGNDPLLDMLDVMMTPEKIDPELDKKLSDEERNKLKKKLEEGKTNREALTNFQNEFDKLIKSKKDEDPPVDIIKELKESETPLEDIVKGLAIPETIEKLFDKGKMALEPSQKKYAIVIIGEFAREILAKREEVDPEETRDAFALLNDRIVEIDEAIGKQLNKIMHHDSFQELEATWRGLHYLVFGTETGKLLKLKVLNVDKKDLLKDVQKAVDYDQSALFKFVYEAEYGTYGGNPYSVLVGDYYFGRHPQDIELLAKLSEVAAAAHAPFISGAYAKLFDMEEFFQLDKPRDLTKIFESLELVKWKSFRQSEDSRYVTLTLPRVLLRLPYGEDTVPTEGVKFEEDVSGPSAKKFLWGNAAYILAQRITNAFALYKWTAAIRGPEGGGLVEGLPAYTFKTADGDIEMTCPTQVTITDRREKELNDLGFMAICHCKGTDKAAFFGGQTTNLPIKYNTDAANANARISGMLPYMMAASRFAHYIKAIMRDKIGSFLTRANVENYLNTWISSYVLLDDAAPQGMKAKFPLREARIDVVDVPGKPGSYKATVFLKPHFQLEELTTSIRLVAELPG